MSTHKMVKVNSNCITSRIYFSWTAASDPMEWPNNWNPSLLTTVFANTGIDDHLNDL